MSFHEFFYRCTGVSPYGFQRAFAEAAILPDLLEAPTGTGKTATAVLGWLWRRLHGTPAQRVEAGCRLIFCLPMRTLVEQTERAVRTWRDRLNLARFVRAAASSRSRHPNAAATKRRQLESNVRWAKYF